MSPRRSVVLAVVAALVLAGCGGARSFQRADQIEILAPASHAWVTQPVELRWTVDAALEERLAAGEVALGVFIDRAPPAPGENLLDFADEDCERSEGCPDASWFADRHIYVTRQSSLRVSGLTDNRETTGDDARDPHEAVIVLLDDAGYRVGESYYAVRFAVDRRT